MMVEHINCSFIATVCLRLNGVCFQKIGNHEIVSCLQGSKGYQGLPGLPGTKGLPVSYYMNLD